MKTQNTETQKTMKTNHTPGPWAAQINNPLAVLPGHTIKSARSPYLPVGIVHAHNGTAGPAEGIANAKLMAAAPDLLKAAEKALQIAENWIHDQLDGTSSLKGALAQLKSVRQAITKAKGA